MFWAYRLRGTNYQCVHCGCYNNETTDEDIQECSKGARDIVSIVLPTICCAFMLPAVVKIVAAYCCSKDSKKGRKYTMDDNVDDSMMSFAQGEIMKEPDEEKHEQKEPDEEKD